MNPQRKRRFEDRFLPLILGMLLVGSCLIPNGVTP